MGAMFNGICYETLPLATDAYFSSVGPFLTSGATSYLTEFSKITGTWKIARYSIASNGTVTTLTQSNAPLVSLPSCDPLEYFVDGTMVGWGIVGALIAAWVIKNMRRGL